ncbi:MFS transporter [Bacillus sp. 2205SS5-2]|uniref:MFS transporter n=1 Tax=Bacillus sp. 2205SS5-2 TaxID=3109031 RepID=UPI003007C45E
MNKRLQNRFRILVGIVAVSGFSQGMLLPIIAIIFEKDGISSSLNGLHATALYIGILFASPLMEVPLRKIGYKPMILIGGIVVVISLFLFPVWKSFWFWFILRLLIGIGDHMLHFATQTWITSFSPEATRGRNISIYGLFFGLGFAAGPMLTKLVDVHEALPFIISAGISFLLWMSVFSLRNEYPEETEMQTSSFLHTFQRFGQVWKYAWIALLPPFGYGFLEASLNGNFPIIALRNGVDIGAIAIILPAFAIGSIVFQLPLGIISDKYGRQSVLQTILLIGAVCFFFAGIWSDSVLGLILTFFFAGMSVGSMFSLGITFMTDLLPKSLLPAGNIMCGVFFSIGSMVGPILGGVIIQFFPGSSFFYLLSTMLFLIFIGLIYFTLKTARIQAKSEAGAR